MLAKLKALRQHQGFMRYFANTSWVMGEKILRMAVGLLVGIWVARYLGPEQFGLLSYAQSFVFLFTAIATLGLDGIVVRELVKDEAQRDILLGTAFGLKLIGAIFIIPVLAIAVLLTTNDDYTNLLIFIIASATIFQSFNVIDFYYQSKVLSKYVAIANTISLSLSSIIKIVLILNKAPLIAFSMIIVFDMAVLAVGLVYFYKNASNLKLFSWCFDWQVAKSLLQDSWPLIFGSVAATIYMKIDQVMISNILSAESVGYYAVAVKLSEVWLFVTVAVTNSIYSSIINVKKIDNNQYLKRLQSIYDLLVKIALIITILVFVFSEKLIYILYGKEYHASIMILNVYIWSTLFVYLSNGSWLYYLTENLSKLASLRLVTGALINIFSNYFFINYFGLLGAAYATVLSYSISGYLFNFFFKKTRINFFLQSKAIINTLNINTWLNPF